MAEFKRYTTPVFRISFPNLFEAKAMDADSKPKFGCMAIFEPSKFSANDKARWQEIGKAMNEESLRRFKKAWKDLPANFKKGIRDGEEKAEMEGLGAGKKFANLTTKIRPGVVSTKKDPETGKYLTISPEEGNADEIYPGCYCRATITVYSYDNKGKGVALGLMNVQKVADGERLDNRTAAEDDFDDDIDAQWLEQDEKSAKDDFGDDDEIPF